MTTRANRLRGKGQRHIRPSKEKNSVYGFGSEPFLTYRAVAFEIQTYPARLTSVKPGMLASAPAKPYLFPVRRPSRPWLHSRLRGRFPCPFFHAMANTFAKLLRAIDYVAMLNVRAQGLAGFAYLFPTAAVRIFKVAPGRVHMLTRGALPHSQAGKCFSPQSPVGGQVLLFLILQHRRPVFGPLTPSTGPGSIPLSFSACWAARTELDPCAIAAGTTLKLNAKLEIIRNRTIMRSSQFIDIRYLLDVSPSVQSRRAEPSPLPRHVCRSVPNKDRHKKRL